ncbi:MAG: 3-phosphoshikimate 1-carboxyvinyltransferase, partial [Desulfovibrio sp.]|nr:3-phosphoshikimate 1-carboxyvinyltransferase [Desulfovibrio sp.]
ILKLLMRRHNLLERMRGPRPRLDPAEEKFLREAWQKAVARVSRDADLSGRFFALMQDAAFLPRPSAEADAAQGEAQAPASERREAFNLAPPHKPVELSLVAPLDCREARAWLFLAAASGEPVKLAPCLMNDPLVDLIKALNQLGAAVTREQEAVVARAAEPMGRPDKVVYVGDSLWNLCLLVAFYVARPSRVKFLGETELKLADLSALRRFLPQLGARFINVIPRSSGLPARLECSGIVPGMAELPPDVPGKLGAALLLAAPFFEQEFTLALGGHPQRADILALVMPLLRAAGISVTEADGAVTVPTGAPKLPLEPALAMEAGLAAFLLALAMPLGGEVRLAGAWPKGPQAAAAREVLRSLGMP